jgi:prepilin peptidase CpaA
MTAVLATLCVSIYLGGLVLAAGWDMFTRTIPNLLLGAITIAAAGRLLLVSPGALAEHGAVALAVLCGGAILFACKLWGAGDAKLLAAAAVVLGTKGLPLLILGTAVVGGILAVVFIANRILFEGGKAPASGLPYGVAIASGAILSFVGTNAFGPLSGL